MPQFDLPLAEARDHEGGQGFHEVEKLRWLAEQFS